MVGDLLSAIELMIYRIYVATSFKTVHLFTGVQVVELQDSTFGAKQGVVRVRRPHCHQRAAGGAHGRVLDHLQAVPQQA